jgi:hypothetical protein
MPTLTIGEAAFELHPSGPRAWDPKEANEWADAVTSVAVGGGLGLPGTAVADADKARLRYTADGRAQGSEDGERYRSFVPPAHIHNVRDYGAVGDWNADTLTGTDDTAAFLATIAAARSGTVGHTVYVPAGSYRITANLLVRGVRPMRFLGDGRRLTVLFWDGVAGEDVLTIEDAQSVEVSDFEIRGSSNVLKRPRACIHLSFEEDDYEFVPALQNLRRLWLGGMGQSTGLPNMCKYGILLDKNDSGQDFNNSEHTLDNVEVDGAELASFKINQNQAKTIRFNDCHANATPIGVDCPDGAFTWIGGAINPQVAGKTGICFEIGAPNDPILIEGLQSEGCGRVLRTGAGVLSGAGHAITLRNSRIAGNLANPDGVMVEVGNRGPFICEGNTFDSWDPVAAVPLQFKLTSSNGAMAADVRNNHFSGTDTYLHSIVKDGAALGVRENGNVYYNAGAGSYFQRRHAGSLNFVEGDTAKVHIFDIPTHALAAGAIPYAVSTSVSARGGGAAQQVLTVTKTVTNITVTLTAVLGAGETLTVDWQIAWK